MHPTYWPTPGLRRASVNSFGIGGSNCHIVLDDAFHYMHERQLTGRHNTIATPDRMPDIGTSVICEAETAMAIYRGENGQVKRPKAHPITTLLVWSSSDKNGINRLIKDYQRFLSKSTTVPKGSWDQHYYQSLAFTLAYRRTLFPYRSFAIVGPSTNLTSIDTIVSKPQYAASVSPKLGFVVTGQGAQWHRMGLELMAYPVFAKSLRKAGSYLQSLGCLWSLEGKRKLTQ